MKTKENDNYILGFVKDYLLSIISECIREGTISKDDDLTHIKEIVYGRCSSSIDRVMFKFIHTDSLEKSVKLEIEHENYQQAILLATTCVEHLLNDFYGQYYECVCKMSNSKIIDILKANGISEKTGGLFLITFNKQFPVDIEQQISLLKKKRNEFAHYKPKKIHIDSLDDDMQKDMEIEVIAKDSILVIESLKKFLSKMEEELYPENLVAKEIFEKIKPEDEDNG